MIDDQYIQDVLDTLGDDLGEQDINLSGYLDLLSTWYRPNCDVTLGTSILLTILIGATLRANAIPQAAEHEVFSDELIGLASNLVYADTGDTWYTIGSVVRKMLNNITDALGV